MVQSDASFLPLDFMEAAVVFTFNPGRARNKILIEDMCRKTAYTGNGQTKIYGEAPGHFICASLK
jgi:hypothetical protein